MNMDEELKRWVDLTIKLTELATKNADEIEYLALAGIALAERVAVLETKLELISVDMGISFIEEEVQVDEKDWN